MTTLQAEIGFHLGHKDPIPVTSHWPTAARSTTLLFRSQQDNLSLSGTKIFLNKLFFYGSAGMAARHHVSPHHYGSSYSDMAHQSRGYLCLSVHGMIGMHSSLARQQCWKGILWVIGSQMVTYAVGKYLSPLLNEVGVLHRHNKLATTSIKPCKDICYAGPYSNNCVASCSFYLHACRL